MNHYKYIVLGSGIAAYAALEELIKETKDICVISKEDECYLRPLLSKTTFSSYNFKVTYLPDIYEGIPFIHEEVKEVDVDNKIINQKYQYETLIYALGAENRKLDSIENGFYLRHIEDFYRIKRELPFVKEVGIIGGGMIGLEVAHLLSKMNKRVNIYEYMDHLIPRYFTKEDSDYLINILASMNVHVECHSRRSDYEEKCVIVSIGNTKNNVFDEPIKVDEKMKFKSDIYACGDCVEGNFALWNEAYEQGKIAGSNALGKEATFEKKTYPVLFHLDKIGVYAGDINSDRTFTRIIENDLFSINENSKKTYISVHDGHIVVIGDLRYVDMVKEGRL